MPATPKNQKSADAVSLGPPANRQWQNQELQQTSTSSPTERLIRLNEVQRLVGLGKSMIYEMIADGRFPAPYKVSSAARWSQDEILKWIESIKRG